MWASHSSQNNYFLLTLSQPSHSMGFIAFILDILLAHLKFSSQIVVLGAWFNDDYILDYDGGDRNNDRHCNNITAIENIIILILENVAVHSHIMMIGEKQS